MSKYQKYSAEVDAAAKKCKVGQFPTYVSDAGLIDGDKIYGIMFDAGRRYWLVIR